MIRLPLPQTQDEVLGFMKAVVHEVNLSKHQAARISTKAGKVIITGAMLQNSADNDEFEAVFNGETLQGEDFTWSERLSTIRFTRLSTNKGLYLLGDTRCSLQLIGL